MLFTPEGFIKVDITDGMKGRALQFSKEVGVLENSIRSGEGNICGALGEEIFLAAFPEAVSNRTFSHDVRLGGVKIEVKTKDRTVYPQDHYDCSLAHFNDRQETNFYVFCSLYRVGQVYVHGFILGYLTPEEYHGNSYKRLKGEIDPFNGHICQASCENLPIHKLKTMHRFCDRLIEHSRSKRFDTD